MTTLCVIPARYGSTRLPGKVLLEIAGKSVIRRVVERARLVKGFGRIVVATDDARVLDHCRSFGAEAVMTGDHPSGSDRVAEVAQSIECDCVVNIQGDEPFFEPSAIDTMLAAMSKERFDAVYTIAFKGASAAACADPNSVKCVVDRQGFALYFSRAPIPWRRDEAQAALAAKTVLIHTGIYAFWKTMLFEFTAMPQGTLERIESLEQLRLLENGRRIRVISAAPWQKGIDTQADLEAAVRARLLR